MEIHTDLALESHEAAAATETSGKIEGVLLSEYTREGFKITRVDVTSENGARLLGKEKGRYVTLEAPGLREKKSGMFEHVVDALKEELSELLSVGENDLVLVACLGNRRITPDALGPKVMENLMVTKHLLDYMPGSFGREFRPVCALAPGVLGITGMETCEIIKGVVERFRPKTIILIDALAARRMSRLVTTFQLSDTGLAPGGGVGNKRCSLDAAFLGAKVISIGVPTVVDAATLTADAISDVLQKGGGEVLSYLHDLSEKSSEEQETIIEKMLSPFQNSLLVTPKEIDDLTDQSAKIIGYAINRALHRGISLEDITAFLE